MKDILLSHIVRYPLMQPCDAVKLVYQSTFGGGHMIPDEKTAYVRLLAEYEACEHDGDVSIESLGDTSRIYINRPLTDAELSLISRMFCASAKHYAIGYDSADEAVRAEFHRRLDLLRELAARGSFGFTKAELDAYLADYIAAGCPAVSHSDAYRAAYAPAYRVISAGYVRLLDCIRAIDARIRTSERVVLAIDGRCASGKTTAANLIAALFDAEIIHMDDFFLPPELRTAERLAETGGNLHRERFMDEVIPNLRGEDGFDYRVFECSTFRYADKPRRVRPAKLYICEGSYALHPMFGKYYDIAAFSDVSTDEQLRRIRCRDGEYMLTRFQNEWIPMEERYFGEFDIRSKCDFILK